MKRRREEPEGATAMGSGSSQAASSSGNAAGQEIARSGGGVQIETDVTAVKRKAEEEGEREMRRRAKGSHRREEPSGA